jgi:hypothetical protein
MTKKIIKLLVESAEGLEKLIKLIQTEITFTTSAIADGAFGTVIVQHPDFGLGDHALLAPVTTLPDGLIVRAVCGRQATAQAGAASTITLDTAASAVNDAYKDLTVSIVGGVGAGQSRVITGYVGATKVATVGSAWATNPDNTSVFRIEGFAEVRVANESGGSVTLTAQRLNVTVLKQGLAL